MIDQNGAAIPADAQSDLEQGDTYRDKALTALRMGKAYQAVMFLDVAEGLHAGMGDRNRDLILQTIKARIRFAHGDYTGAEQLHRVAATEWHHMGGLANPEWVAINRFHWFRALTAVGNIAQYKWVEKMYREIITTDPVRHRRIGARIVYHFPHLGNAIYDWLMKQSPVRS